MYGLYLHFSLAVVHNALKPFLTPAIHLVGVSYIWGYESQRD